MTTCARRGCDREGALTPVLVLCTAAGVETCEAAIGLEVCEDHQSVDAEQYVTDESWERLQRSMRDADLPALDRGRTRVRYASALDPIVLALRQQS